MKILLNCKNDILEKCILSFCFIITSFYSFVKAQSYTENFEDINSLANKDWVMSNKSFPLGTNTWMQGIDNLFPFQAGNDYIAANYNNTSPFGDNNTISNWIITPNRTFKNGDTFSFYTRKQYSNNTPDRLEVRFSSKGKSVNVGNSATDVGDFEEVLLSINPDLKKGEYPSNWVLYTVTISNLVAPTSGRIAFRYFVTNAGLEGENADYIAIDNVTYTKKETLATEEMQDDHFMRIYPNPVKETLYFDSKLPVTKALIFSLDGKKIIEKTLFPSDKNIDVKHLINGVYLINLIYNNNKSKTVKFIKE